LKPAIGSWNSRLSTAGTSSGADSYRHFTGRVLCTSADVDDENFSWLATNQSFAFKKHDSTEMLLELHLDPLGRAALVFMPVAFNGGGGVSSLASVVVREINPSQIPGRNPKMPTISYRRTEIGVTAELKTYHQR
jgi:hypothetical protein